VRVLLALLLIHGLAPGFSEAVEAAVHWARVGHAAHTADDHGDLGDQGAEHGCGTTQHRCTCCSAQEVAPSGEVAVSIVGAARTRPLAPSERPAATRDPARPFRPPIS
jgi:hypothetical protein